MHHRLQWFIHMQAHGLKGRWAPRLHSSWGTAYFTFFAKQCGLGRALQWGNYDRAVPLSPGAFLLGGVCCTTFVPPYSTWSLLCISTFKTISSSTDSTASYRHISTYRTHTNQYYVYKLYMGHRRVTVLDMLPKFLLICHQAAECSCAIPHEQCRQGAHLPFLGLKPTGGQTTEICDAWPVRCQYYGYLPSPLTGTKLYCLVTDVTTFQGCYLIVQGWESSPQLSESQVQRPN